MIRTHFVSLTLIACMPFLSGFAPGAPSPVLSGRLFNSAQQRADLDRMRHARLPPPPEFPVREISLDGIVWQDKAKPLFWINGRLVETENLLTAVGHDTARIRRSDGRYDTLRVGERVFMPAPDGLP